MASRETVDAAVGVSAAPAAGSQLPRLERALSMVLRGKPEAVRLSLACLLARGHLLIEDVPGVGKTTLAQALASAVSCSFHRLQFTSDMLPSDVLGVTIFNTQTQAFEFKQGPVFTNFLLADEINRTTPKTQSALLEAMNEQQITIDGRSYALPRPFMVIATQNPVEHHGTYPLPESQLDRFLMRIRIGYPDTESERAILANPARFAHGDIDPIVSAAEILDLQEQCERITVDASLESYILGIVSRTRSHDALVLGVSPRGAQALYRAAQALAMLDGRGYATPDDIKRLAGPVFGHRLTVNPRVTFGQSPGAGPRRADVGDRVIEDILQHVEVPL